MAAAVPTLTQGRGIEFRLGRRWLIWQAATMAFVIVINLRDLHNGGSRLHWFAVIAFSIILVSSIWQMIRGTTVAVMNSSGVKVRNADCIPWHNISGVELQPIRPSWAFTLYPQRVYVFKLRDLNRDGLPKARWQRYYMRRNAKKYGTPLVLAEMLIRQPKTEFFEAVQSIAGLSVVKTAVAIKKPNLTDRWLGPAALWIACVGLGAVLAFGREAFSIRGLVVAVPVTALFIAVGWMWRRRLRRLRKSSI